MRKIFCLLLAWGCMAVTRAQHTIHCGNQVFTINAKKLTPVKQLDPQSQAIINTSFYYQLQGNKLKVWMETGDTLTRSFALYEIDRAFIDKESSQQIVDYDQQDYTAPVKTLYIKCGTGKKDVSVTGYVDWTNEADRYPWSFIFVSSYDKAELENMLAEINTWLKQ